MKINKDELLNDWRGAVKRWVSGKRASREYPGLADNAVRFFERAFSLIEYPDDAYFGVHTNYISLCVGNIWLASLSFNSHRVFLLVDKRIAVKQYKHLSAKSTEHYTPLYWLTAPPFKITEILSLEKAWKAYSNACQKVLDAPISKTRILKNQKHKARLSEIIKELPFAQDASWSSKEQSEFLEGAIQEVTLELRQRDPKLRKEAIEKYGLKCQVCGFSFGEFYGELGEGYIEVHHLNPLSERDSESATRLDEVAVVCANCHRMLHRNGKIPISIEALRLIIKQNKLPGQS